MPLRVQSDGRILVAGEGIAGNVNFVSTFPVVRYNTDGSLDSTFGSGGFVFIEGMLWATDLVIQPDGRIVVVGDKYTDEGADLLVARFAGSWLPTAT